MLANALFVTLHPRLSTKQTLKPQFSSLQRRYNIQPDQDAISHMAAASVGEAAACMVRVPTEVVKAKMQTGTGAGGLRATIQLVLNETHGSRNILTPIVGGLYRGYGITLMREIPFAMIQFPLYEQFKVSWGNYQGTAVSPVQAAACGSFAGAIAAGATTPLDVVKTRLMLGVDQNGKHYKNAIDVMKRTMAEDPMKFWSGLQPRVMWISIGGFVFFGAYEGFRSAFSNALQ
jgi:solute carrier family 25 (mitochondrial S-adenosylmethionine transporter), member 26